jgi:hypothetical protein
MNKKKGGERMKRKMKKVFSLFLLFVLTSVVLSISSSPVSACNAVKLPPGASRIDYYFGGNATIDLPAGLPNYPSATKINFAVYAQEAGSDPGVVTLLVSLYLTATATSIAHWSQVAHLATSANVANFLRTFWHGSTVEFDSTIPPYNQAPYNMPPSYGTDNVIQVSKDTLKVERHGNSVYVSMNAPQQIKKVGPDIPTYYYILPPFSLELKKYGGSVDEEGSVMMSGYPGASLYRQDREIKGFYANGAFTCNSLGWSYSKAPTSEAFITMNGILTFYPPAFGNTNIETYQDRNDAHAKSASYFKSSFSGTVTDIFAYISRVCSKGDAAAAIYEDNGGSPGALIAATDKATARTTFSWVDFKFTSPVSLIAGTGYWLAISSNNALNMKIVVGSGVRINNEISNWFSDPFGPVWDIHDIGAMSIYASGTSTLQL